MMRTAAWLSLLALLGACAAAPGPVAPERPECAKPTEKEPVDGGLGGTGNAPSAECPPEED